MWTSPDGKRAPSCRLSLALFVLVLCACPSKSRPPEESRPAEPAGAEPPARVAEPVEAGTEPPARVAEPVEAGTETSPADPAEEEDEEPEDKGKKKDKKELLEKAAREGGVIKVLGSFESEEEKEAALERLKKEGLVE